MMVGFVLFFIYRTFVRLILVLFYAVRTINLHDYCRLHCSSFAVYICNFYLPSMLLRTISYCKFYLYTYLCSSYSLHALIVSVC